MSKLLTLLMIVSLTLVGCGDDDPATGPDANHHTGDADAAPGTADAPPGTPDGSTGTPDSGGTTGGGDPAEAGDFDAHLADNVTIPAGGNASITATICSPSTDGGSSAAPGKYPLAILSPGFQLDRAQYTSACRHLASWGYVVILQTYSQSGFSINHQTLAEDVGRIIDWALGAQSGLADRLDGDKIAVAGHSLGGKISILASTLDNRIKVVVGWDPVDENSPSVTPEQMGKIKIPIAVIGETLDSAGGFMPCAPAANNYTQYFEHACAAPRALEVTVEGADHMDWVDDKASCGFVCSFCQNGPTDDAVTRKLTRRMTTAFFERTLRNDAGMETYLSAPGIGSGVTLRTSPTKCQ